MASGQLVAKLPANQKPFQKMAICWCSAILTNNWSGPIRGLTLLKNFALKITEHHVCPLTWRTAFLIENLLLMHVPGLSHHWADMRNTWGELVNIPRKGDWAGVSQASVTCEGSRPSLMALASGMLVTRNRLVRENKLLLQAKQSLFKILEI